VQVANAAACTLLDLEPPTVIGQPVQSLFLEPLPYALGGLAHGEVRARTRLGRELTLDLRAFLPDCSRTRNHRLYLCL